MEWKKEWTTPSVVGVISFGVGVAAGYFLKTYLDKREEKIVYTIRERTEVYEEEEEGVGFPISHTLDDIAGSRSQEEYDREKELWERSQEELRMSLNESNEAMEEAERNSVFTEVDPNWNYEEELKHRTEDAPYILHRDEYLEEDNGYSQTTLTFYASDQVLVDTDDTPIYDAHRLVGELIFGKGSGDPSVVYVRNDRLMAEYEVLLEPGYYQVEVLGEVIEQDLSQEKSVVHKLRPE